MLRQVSLQQKEDDVMMETLFNKSSDKLSDKLSAVSPTSESSEPAGGSTRP